MIADVLVLPQQVRDAATLSNEAGMRYRQPTKRRIHMLNREIALRFALCGHAPGGKAHGFFLKFPRVHR
jgi:hypothetical protein